MLLLLTSRPILNLPEDSLPCSLQAPLSVSTEVIGICGRMSPVKEDDVSQFLVIGEPVRTTMEGSRTDNKPTTLMIDILLQ